MHGTMSLKKTSNMCPSGETWPEDWIPRSNIFVVFPSFLKANAIMMWKISGYCYIAHPYHITAILPFNAIRYLLDRASSNKQSDSISTLMGSKI